MFFTDRAHGVVYETLSKNKNFQRRRRLSGHVVSKKKFQKKMEKTYDTVSYRFVISRFRMNVDFPYWVIFITEGVVQKKISGKILKKKFGSLFFFCYNSGIRKYVQNRLIMIEEQYVSFEIAKLLKEKGFNIPCRFNYRSTYTNSPKPFYHKSLKDFNGEEYEGLRGEWFSAPTHQMALKWLREVHHYYIQVMLDSWAWGGHTGYYVVIQKTDSDFEIMLQDFVDEVLYQTYEDACEAAIKYCLENLIS